MMELAKKMVGIMDELVGQDALERYIFSCVVGSSLVG